MRVLVCGGRHYEDAGFLYQTLDAIHTPTSGGITQIIAGGASGADSLAAAWAVDRSLPCKIFHAKWQEHGRAAGPIRNQQMLDEGRPDLVVAFPGGRGTADMVRKSRAAGFPVQIAGDDKKDATAT